MAQYVGRENGTRHFPRWSLPRATAWLEGQRKNESGLHPAMMHPGLAVWDKKGVRKKRWQRRRTFLGKQELVEQFRGRQRLASTASAAAWRWWWQWGQPGCQHQRGLTQAQPLAQSSLPIELANWLGKQLLINCQTYFSWVARAASPGTFTKQSIWQMLLEKRKEAQVSQHYNRDQHLLPAP